MRWLAIENRLMNVFRVGKMEIDCSIMQKWDQPKRELINPNWTFSQRVLGSRLFIQTSKTECDFSEGDGYLGYCFSHTNSPSRYLRLPVEEVTGLIIDSSNDRLETFCSFPAPKTRQDVINMLGDRSGKRHCVFWESHKEEPVKTVAVGMWSPLFV